MTEHTASPRPTAWWPSAAIVTSGLALGIVTQILQGVLPDHWGVLANSGVMWAVMAFALGAALPTDRWAIVGGAAQLVTASIIYYMAVSWFETHSSNPRSTIIWSAAGIAAGSVFGLAGHWSTSRRAWRYPALALVAGVLVGEGLHLTWLVGNPDLRPAGITELILSVIVAGFCLAGSLRSRLQRAPLITAGVTLAAATCTLAAGKLIDAVFLAS